MYRDKTKRKRQLTGSPKVAERVAFPMGELSDIDLQRAAAGVL